MASKVETKVYRSVGSSAEAQLAHRVGEQVCFVRYRQRDPRYGWSWSAWRETTMKPYLQSNGHDPASWSETESGWIEITYNKPSVRLPKN
jgi:hypothetical protein